MAKDISYRQGQERFRYRAAALIIEEEALCVISSPSEDYFYSVGGAVRFGETSEEAVQREVFEETGQKYEIEKLAFVHENLFSNSTGILKGLDCHEICFYYLMKPHGKQFDYQHKQEQVYWIPLTDLENYKVFPKEITHILKHLQTGIQHIISKKESGTEIDNSLEFDFVVPPPHS